MDTNYKINAENFIVEIVNFVPEDYCDLIIKTVEEKCFSLGNFLPGKDNFGSALKRKDYSVFMPSHIRDEYKTLNNIVYDGLKIYSEIIDSVQDVQLLSYDIKIQKTVAGDPGYSAWHSEQNSGSSANRAIAWVLYLNDVQDGGETEFLYQRKKVCPEKGKFVLWPAGFTHPHRGNPPYSNDKYIATGWFRMPNELEEGYLLGLNNG